jgi:hypothetical protein
MSRPGKHLAALLLAALAWPAPAHAADIKINPPSADEGEFSFEDNSAVALRKGRSSDAKQSHFIEYGYGINEWWWTELEGHWETGTDGFRLRTTDLENAFRLVEQEDYWPETSLFIELDQPVDGHTPFTVSVAGLFRKDFDRFSTTLNLFLDRDYGRNAEAGTRLRYIGISTWSFLKELAVGAEFYGLPGRLGHFGGIGEQDHRLGPVVTGEHKFSGIGEVSYTLGYLQGLTPAAPKSTLIWRLEYDFRF